MRGSIEQRGTGQRKKTWRITVDVGRDSEGKRKRHIETVEGNKRDAERRLREIITSLDQGLYVAPSKTTTGEYLMQWAETYAALRPSPRTAESYRAQLSGHIIPAIGHIALLSLQPEDLERYYVQALKQGRKDGKGGLSARTVLYHHRIISEALQHAVIKNKLARNPAKLAQPPKPNRVKITTLTRDDALRFLEAARQSEYFPLFAVALGSGARLGELLALTWRNVDLEQGIIVIDATLYREGATWARKPTKSDRVRHVDLPPQVVGFLGEYRRDTAAVLGQIGAELTPDDFVFTSSTGKPLNRHNVTRALGRVLGIAGLSHIRFHDLRHTHASLLLQNGESPKTVQERLGHASAAFTLDVYGHIQPGMQKEAARRFGAVYGNALREANQ